MPVPTVLVSHDTLLVDDVLQLRNLVDGLADNELPGHADQLRALRLPSRDAGGRPTETPV
jgi:hypothetical protein